MFVSGRCTSGSVCFPARCNKQFAQDNVAMELLTESCTRVGGDGCWRGLCVRVATNKWAAMLLYKEEAGWKGWTGGPRFLFPDSFSVIYVAFGQGSTA